jgi:integrase
VSPGRVLTTHSLRHTYATRMLCTLVKSEKGRWAERSADNVRRKLGHRTSDLVERVYGHETDGERRTKALSFERSRKLPAKRLRMEEAALVAC